jgi:hypothetical protein
MKKSGPDLPYFGYNFGTYLQDLRKTVKERKLIGITRYTR